MEKLLLTNHANNGSRYAARYGPIERDAAEVAGFTVVPISIGDALEDNVELGNSIRHKSVFLRHHANDDMIFGPYVRQYDAHLLVPEYEQADRWYTTVPLDENATRWLGGRLLDWLDLTHIDTEMNDPDKFQKDVDAVIDTIYDKANGGPMFIKAPRKRSHLEAKLYSPEEAKELLIDDLTMNVHAQLTEVMYSQPVSFAKYPTGIRRQEYRCLIVGNTLSSVSLYTSHKYPRNYDEVMQFAQDFAECFTNKLPNSYCLDVARLVTGRLAVVELNQIGPFGFYADNDIYKFFRDAYKLE